MTPEVLVTTLTPLLIYGVAELIKWARPQIKGFTLLILNSSLATVLALMGSIVIAPDAGFLTTFSVGMLTVTVNQFIKQWKSGN